MFCFDSSLAGTHGDTDNGYDDVTNGNATPHQRNERNIILKTTVNVSEEPEGIA